jgi:uncharacterized protein (TIGR02271 family)
MDKTVIGLLNDFSEARRVVQALIDEGFARDDISLIARQDRTAAKESGSGWAARTLSVPGIGPLQATGPLAAVLESASGDPEAGGLRGVLTDRGVPTDEAEFYIEGLRRGGAVVAVDTDNAYVDRAVALMQRDAGLARGTRDLEGDEARGSRRGGDMETIERSVEIDVPVQTAYREWTHFEQFPRFMEGVEEVRRLDAKRLHWVANIAGQRKEWDAEITEEIPNERLAWRSKAGEWTAGVATFQPLGANRTRVRVQFDYEPKGVTEKIGDMLGMVSRRVEGDLERFKKFVEGHGQERGARRESERTQVEREARPATTVTPSRGASRFEDYDADFQRHYRTAFADRGQPYEYWTPAYRYGYTLAADPRYAGRDWSAIEVDARRQWGEHHQGRWEDFKDAVRYGWESMRGRHHAGEGEVRIPVIEEELQVGKRQVERGGARVYSRVIEQPVEEQVSLRQEEVSVERRPVDRPATEHDLAAFKEGTIEVTETREEAVISKRARVVEEVVIDKNVEEHTETVRDTVRRTEVEVEPAGAEPATRWRDFAAYEPEFRTHYTAAFAARGASYDRWAPAYRYGYDVATDPRYRDRDWAAIETDVRRDWDRRQQGPWEEFKEAIRYGWDKVRGRR